jgi:hypothetical protein
MLQADKPNIVFALASSYNERGVQGYTHTVTNSEDQRKVNVYYELAKNQITGKGTLTLSKRPGATDASGGANWGSSTQSVYLIITRPYQAITIPDTVPWVVSRDGSNNNIVSSSNVDTTILNSATYFPCFIDKTIISLDQYAVLQLRKLTAGNVQRMFYATVIGGWTEITDADFTALTHVGKAEHIDGFMFILEMGNRIFNSDNNSLANWTNTSFIAKGILSDAPVGLARLNNQLLAFGDNTVEAFYNAGNSTGSPLGRIATLSQRVGMIAPNQTIDGTGHYYCTIGNRIFFVGRASGGAASAGAFTFDGQTFDKISTPYIDKILSEVALTTFYSVNAVGFHGQAAVAILLTSPNATSQRWLMFFPYWKEWFEWTSDIYSPINSGDYFLACSANNKANIYNFPSSDNWQDAGTSYPWSTQFRFPPANGASRTFLLMYGVDADKDTVTNNLTVEISTDDCATFSTLGTIDLTQDRKVLMRGGSFRKAHIRLGNTNARPARLHSFLARIE